MPPRRIEPERERHLARSGEVDGTVRLVAHGLRIALLAAWVALGGLWVFTTFVMWQVNPSDDVDRGPSGRLFWWSLLTWVLVGLALLAWRRRRLRHDR
jgi:hypothetical protein